MYLEANSCLFLFSADYRAMASFFSEQRIRPMVGLSSPAINRSSVRPAQREGKSLNGIAFFYGKAQIVQNSTSLVEFVPLTGFSTNLVANHRFPD